MPIGESQFVKLTQKRIANTSIGASTVRGRAPGTARSATHYLEALNLQPFAATETNFRRALNRATNALCKRLPEDSWGHARKFLNIFLRGANYDRFLCEAYDFRRAEPWLEVPLDSNVAKSLLKAAKGRAALPRWRGIKYLDPQTSELYQDFALEVAEAKGVKRVHLDLIYWRSSPPKIAGGHEASNRQLSSASGTALRGSGGRGRRRCSCRTRAPRRSGG